MTKLGVLSDVHGNLPALEATLDEMRGHGVEEIACVGDVVGVLGWPEETVQLLRDEVDHCVYGNHDSYVRPDYPYVPEHPVQKQEHRLVTGELSRDSLEWLTGLPEVEYLDGLVMGHANPFVANAAGYPADEYVEKGDWTHFGAKYVEGEMVVIGHTHEQGSLDLSKFDGQDGAIVNPGAVGAPYYGNAEYAIVDTETRDITLYSVEYDTGLVEDRFDELGLKTVEELDRKP